MVSNTLTLLDCGCCRTRAHQVLTRVGAGRARRFVCDDCLSRVPPDRAAPAVQAARIG